MEYKNSDILLYSVRNNKIVVIYNDKEKMEKYLSSGIFKEAPIKVFNYSNELEKKLLSEMKKIVNIETMPDSNIKITYKDGTEYVFAESNRETIFKIKNAQDNLTREKIIGDFAKLPEEEKAKKKANIAKTARAGLAGALATILLAGGIHHGAKLAKNNYSDEINDSKPGVEDTVEPTATPTPTVAPMVAITNEELQEYADFLYNDLKNSDAYLLRLQQTTLVPINKELAYSIVELINGIYPTRLVSMSDQQADAEMVQIRETIELIHASDFNNSNPANSMINLADYIKDPMYKELLTETLYVAREVVNESIGEPIEGTILEDYNTKHPFSKEYINAVDKWMHHTWETMNKAEFLDAPMGVRTVFTSIWFQMVAQVPRWSRIENVSSEYEPREHDMYINYFTDMERHLSYIPRESETGKVEYVLRDQYCHEEIYTEYEMYDLAGIPYEIRDYEPKLKRDPNIVQMGIFIEIRNRINKQDNELYNNYEEMQQSKNK